MGKYSKLVRIVTDHIRSLAVQAGLLEDSHPAGVTPPKRADPPRAMTAPKATSETFKPPSDIESAAAVARFIEYSTSGASSGPSLSEPSPCPAAGEDDTTPKAEVRSMDWAEDSSEGLPPLPIDFGSSERSSGSSIHCPDNAMIDDSADIVAVQSFRDPDAGALALTPTPPPPSPPTTEPQSEVAQLFNLIMDTIRPMQEEIKRIGDKVDGKPTPRPTQPAKTRAAPLSRAQPTPRPSTHTPSPPSHTPSPPTQRVDDDIEAPDMQTDSDPSFPPLGPSGGRKARYRRKVTAERDTQNALVPGAPALGQRNPSAGFMRAPPIFALVVTQMAMGDHTRAASNAKTARDIQKCNPSGKLKPGHSAAPCGFTEVVVTRNGGLDDKDAEEAFRRKIPVNIVQAAQRALNKASRNPPLILRGRWTENVCHGSAGTPLGTHAGTEALGPQDARTAIRT
jgi:hypothetical protein